MLQRTFLTGLAVTLLVVQACGSDDGKRKVTSSDAGMGGEAGAPDGPDSGGSSAGMQPSMTGGEPAEPTGGMGGTGEEPTAGAGGQPPLPLPPDPEVLFTVAFGAIGLSDTAISSQLHPENVIYTSNSGSQDEIDGDNAVKIVGADLGLAESDAIVSFTLLQPEPQDPVYLFSVVDGTEGATPTSVNDAYWSSSDEEGDVYFSEGVESYRELGEGGDQYGYNGRLMSEVSLGLTTYDGETQPDNLRGLMMHDANQPITELFFTTNTDAVGLADSVVEATAVDERACTVFKSELDGTSSVAFSCAALGLVAGDQIDALLVYGTAAPSEVIFSVTSGSLGASGSAVEAAVTLGTPVDDSGATLFRSSGDGSNTLHLLPRALGLGYEYGEDDLDALAVINGAPASVTHAATCTLSYDPLDLVNGGELTSIGGTNHIGDNVLVVFGYTAASPRLIAYNPITCAFIQQKDMPVDFPGVSELAIAKLPAWSATAPLDAVEYFQALDNGQTFVKEIHRRDAAGAFLNAVPTDLSYYPTPVALLHEPVKDVLYLLVESDIYPSYPYALDLVVMPRPTAASTELAAQRYELGMPCTNSPGVVGTDQEGNLYLSQLQGTDPEYRVCGYTPYGALLPLPYSWTPETLPEQRGFIVGRGSHFLFSTNNGAGPFTIERGVFTPP